MNRAARWRRKPVRMPARRRRIEEKSMSFSESVRAVLGASTPDRRLRGELQGLGVAPTVLNSIHWAMSGKAAKGDPSAAKYLRDTLEEEPELPAPEKGERADLSALTDGELLAMVRQGGRRTP